MNNIPKSTEFWNSLLNSGDDFCGPEVSSREDGECFKFLSNKTMASVWREAPDFDANNSTPSIKDLPPESLFPDLSLSWSARPFNKLWSPSGVTSVDWSVSSKSPWQNDTFENDSNKSQVAASFHATNPTDVLSTTSCDNVFQNIWATTLERRSLIGNTNPSDPEPGRTGTVAAETSVLSTNQPHSSTQELFQDQRNIQHDKPVIAVVDKVANEGHSDIISQLINTNEGWGSRGIDQSTRWDSAMGEEESTTDGAHNGLVPVFLTSHQLSNRQQESNVWTNEPPTGTGIWELHYEQMANKTARCQQQEHEIPQSGGRNTSPSSSSSPHPLNAGPFIHQQPMPQSGGADFGFWGNRAGGRLQGHVAPPLSHFDSSVANTFASAFRRPVLGGSSSSRPSDESRLCVDTNWSGGTGWPPIDSNDKTTWMSVAVSRSGPFFPASDDSDQQPQNSDSCGSTTPGVHPYSHTYRADLVRYFVQLGYRKEEVQAVLIECNMDIDRSLALLRQRYRGTGIFRPPLSHRTLSSSGQIGPPPVFGRSVSGLPVRPSTGGCKGMPVSSHSFTALNNGKMPGLGQDSFSLSHYSSLLGLPPPQENTPSASSNTAAIRGRVGHWPPSPTANPSVFPGVADLQKKRQEIVRQMQLYRNNAALCSQPQYTALLNELSAQLQHVESQICAKEAAGYSSAALCGVVDAPGADDDGRSFNSASLNQRLHDMRILGGGGGGGGSPCNNNPPSPRSGYKPPLNGFRNPRGGDGWLLIRCPPTATAAFESMLSQMPGFLQFHNLESRCMCLARFISSETAMEAAFHLGVGGSSTVAVDPIAERYAQVLLMDAMAAGK